MIKTEPKSISSPAKAIVMQPIAGYNSDDEDEVPLVCNYVIIIGPIRYCIVE